MIQKDFKEPVFEFVKLVSELEEVTSITLYGSVAKGDAKADSDIDLLVVVSNMQVEKKIKEIANELEDRFNRKIQVIVSTNKLEGLDSSMIEDISTTGILLYGLPIKVKHGDLDLEPYTVAIYSLADLPQSEKMRFKRALFGSESVFIGKKKYKTVQEGLLRMFGGARLGRGAVIFPAMHKEIAGQLEYFKVKFKTFTVYANKDLLDWIKTFEGHVSSTEVKKK